jgi:hypothetical protein
MGLFFRAFNAQTLAAIGIHLPPNELNELIEQLADTLRQRYTPGADPLVECMRLFQEVEEHASEIMGWRRAA